MNILLRRLFAALAFCAGAAAQAHHSFSPVYDGARTITVEGIVREFRFVNPHSMMKLEVTDAQGQAVVWDVEFPGVLNLTRGGWTSSTFKIGEHIKVSGNPTHTGSAGVFFRSAVLGDGAELKLPGGEEIDAIEEQRRQRAAQRQGAR
jgi:hypothetical protein